MYNIDDIITINLDLTKTPQGKRRPRVLRSGRTYHDITEFEKELTEKLVDYQNKIEPNQYIDVTININDIRFRSDIDNIAKAVLDVSQKVGVFQNDSKIKNLTITSNEYDNEPHVHLTYNLNYQK